MLSGSALSRAMLWIIAGGLPFTAFAQSQTASIGPIPRDSSELVTGQPQIAATAADREAALQLLTRARQAYQLRNAGQAWDLKVRFTVDSSGVTNYDGAWQMEDLFAPGQGVHWTAQSSAGYSITGIFAAKAVFAEATASVIPLRLQEARAMLFNPIPSVAYARNGSVRTFSTSRNGSPLTCVLLAHSRKLSFPPLGRSWMEAEECIDSQSGLLQIHSEVPGRYAVYDYSDAPQLGGHLLPRTVTITEAGRVVSKISVVGLEGIAAPDTALFVPTERMQAAGPATAMTSATKISRLPVPGPFQPGITVRPIYVFGLVTPTGQLVEAHSLQPSDPNSDAALKDARSIDFSPLIHAGAPPQQHFVFVLENFVSAQSAY